MLDNSPPELIDEIVLIDDLSDDRMQKHRCDECDYHELFVAEQGKIVLGMEKVRILRNPTRYGIVV